MNALMVEMIARVAHEANRAYCAALGDRSQPAWDDAPQWQRDSACSGAHLHLAGDLTPRQSHEAWMRHKEAEGWIYGPVKDPDRKQHPSMLPYHLLPATERLKDHLFRNIVRAFVAATTAEGGPA